MMGKKRQSCSFLGCLTAGLLLAGVDKSRWEQQRPSFVHSDFSLSRLSNRCPDQSFSRLEMTYLAWTWTFW